MRKMMMIKEARRPRRERRRMNEKVKKRVRKKKNKKTGTAPGVAGLTKKIKQRVMSERRRARIMERDENFGWEVGRRRRWVFIILF